jgi:hypothetical protein
MNPIVGIFTERAAAERAAAALEAQGIPRERMTILVPGHADSSLAEVPTTESEPPGVGRALGGVVGGAAGAAGGIQAGVLTSVLVPGVGPVIALGLLGAALFGAAGAAVGQALDESLREGLPKDEVFVYEDALRRGRSVLAALVADAPQADAARHALEAAGAETVDAARERWWIGLREAEAADYTAQGGEFTRDEIDYRRGFEAALSVGGGGRAYAEMDQELRARYPDAYARGAFRRGYERGQAYAEARRRGARAA